MADKSQLDLIGQVLDGKYRINRQLGEGGMGAVYLATHLGTERPVALKLIVPRFMADAEFVERFRREARAAGRLIHPNVVNVTDFGFAEIDSERAAYLVMEYLDGCTLADVLAEEKRLPLNWVIDCIEQVCSAMQEAHTRGILHRDLKPQNIWLEPNRRGGYTVKVLDFGLAKLDEAGSTAPVSLPSATSSAGAATQPILGAAATNIDRGEAATLISDHGAAASDEQETKILPAQTAAITEITDDEKTRLMDAATAADRSDLSTNAADGLTRVGSVLGTPLYMSPEQCTGGVIDARSDIYSLGVIVYQMLAGDTPFTGDTQSLIKSHIETVPPSLASKRPDIPRKVAALIMSALAKNPDDRPQTAEAFASALRAYSENSGALIRRAFALYSEHFPTFFKLSLMANAPLILIGLVQSVTATLGALDIIPSMPATIATVILALCSAIAGFFAAAVTFGVAVRLVTQLFLAPLRPIQIKPALKALRKRLKPFFTTTLLLVVWSTIGFVLCVIPGIIIQINGLLSSPIVMMENLKGRAALRRSKVLVKRSRWTAIVIYAIHILIPVILTSGFTLMITLIAKEFDGYTKIRGAIRGSTNPVIQPFVSLFISPLTSIITTLLYLKTRQAGGEQLREMLTAIEEEELPTSKWQVRMRELSRGHTPSAQ